MVMLNQVPPPFSPVRISIEEQLISPQGHQLLINPQQQPHLLVTKNI